MRTKKSLGQNFLNDNDVSQRIVDALGLTTGETVIEIGPGRGALTEKLLETGANVIAIEIDRELVPALRVQFHFQPHLTVVEADVLETDLIFLLENVDPLNTKLVGNLPYNISTPILQRLIEQRDLYSNAVLMFQREVVQRITARPGGKERGFLSVLVENAFATDHLFDVSPTAFIPVPKVWSAVVRLIPKIKSHEDDPHFRRILSLSFAQKRKTILNNLKPHLSNAGKSLSDAGIDGQRRAETLTLDEWKNLSSKIGLSFR